MTAFLDCLPFSLNVEAGYQHDRNDSGNWSTGHAGVGILIGTNRGVTAPVLAEWRAHPVTAADMQALTVAEATAIYAARYWNPIRGDDLPPGVNQTGLDLQINAGSNGARCLQRAAGLTGVDVDGWIGAETLAAIAAADAKKLALKLTKSAAAVVQTALGLTADGQVGPKTLAALSGRTGEWLALCGRFYDERMAFYRAAPGYVTYGAGWSARARDCLTASVKMALAAGSVPA